MKTAMQELFSQLEIEHPNLFNTNTLEGRKFINDYYKFFEFEQLHIINSYNSGCIDTLKDEIKLGVQYYNETFKLEV
jgi:hypothetical protein